METIQTESGTHVVSVNDSRVFNEEDELSIRNTNLRVFYETVQLSSEGNIVHLSYIPWRKPALAKRED